MGLFQKPDINFSEKPSLYEMNGKKLHVRIVVMNDSINYQIFC